LVVVVELLGEVIMGEVVVRAVDWPIKIIIL
jgi:hypothetical protein